MNLQSLCEKLVEACEEFNEDFDVNHGGCCYLALAIAKEFDKRGISYTLIVDSHDDMNEETIAEEVLNRTRNLGEEDSVIGYHTRSHYYLLCNGTPINENGYYEYEIEIPVTDYLPIKWIYEHGDWNEDYDPRFNKYIRLYIKQIFKQYDREREEAS